MPLSVRPLVFLCVLAGTAGTAACARSSPLLRPDRVERVTAPDTFAVRFETSKGPVTIEFYRAWAPRGADRVFFLVENGFYDETRFFRVIPRFVAQWGANGDTKVNAVWERRVIPDDPIKVSNGRGTVAFAHAGRDTRTTQLFVNLANNARLDSRGFTPVGRVVEGLARVDALYGGYGDGPPTGRGPDQDRMAAEGNEYLIKYYPRLDFVRGARIVRESGRR